MAKTAYSLVLKSQSKTLGTLRVEAGGDTVQVGRSHVCALRTPDGDLSVSAVHAKVYWKGGTLLLEDVGSRNGVYYRGLRLKKPHRMAPGDVYAIGNCSLLCERIGKETERPAAKFHKLECLNGDHAGRMFDIHADEHGNPFSIGLDPANSIRLPDMLVSRKHATLTVKENGDCWLKDLDSRNGTYVNGEPLHGKERLLKDNDKISIAYFDFRFLDRTVTHTRFFLWVKIIAVAATLCVMAGAYVMWVTASATVDDYLRQVRQLAAARDFTAARRTLDDARIARDADKYRAQIDALDVQIEQWERTSSEWNRAQALLRDGAFPRARRLLDPLTSGTRDAWIWNGTTAVEEKRRAEFCAQALRWYYDAEDVLVDAGAGQPEQQADNIQARAVPFRQFLHDSAELIAAQPYVAALTNKMAQTCARMEAIRQGFQRVDECIAKLDAFNPDFGKLAAQLDAVIQDKTQHAAVRAYADKYKTPCAELAAAKLFIRKEFEDLNAMRFKAVQGKAERLKLPRKELCSRHPRLSEHRMKLDGHHAEVQSLAVSLASMVDGLAEKGVAGNDCGQALEHVLDIDLWKNVLTFDCFNGKPPTVRRKVPSSSYDELLGVDFTFQSLRALPENYNGWCLRMIGFSPDVVEARKTMEYVDVFVKFVSARPAWLRKGELGAFHTSCLDLQARRKRLVDFLSSYKGTAPRAELITRFYAGYFSDDFDIAKRKALADRFKRIQREVSELCETYSNVSNPFEQINVRAKILTTGIPGDAQLHAKWVQKYEGNAK